MVVPQESISNLQILGLYFINFEIIVVSDGFIFREEVQLCFHHSQTAVEAETLSKENHVCLCWPVSMARLCLLGLHNINALLWYVMSLGFSRIEWLFFGFLEGEGIGRLFSCIRRLASRGREVYVFEWICVIG